MDGQGVFTWPDGRRYEGGWRKGKQNGMSKYRTATGEIWEGQWEDGVMHKWNDNKKILGHNYKPNFFLTDGKSDDVSMKWHYACYELLINVYYDANYDFL